MPFVLPLAFLAAVAGAAALTRSKGSRAQTPSTRARPKPSRAAVPAPLDAFVTAVPLYYGTGRDYVWSFPPIFYANGERLPDEAQPTAQDFHHQWTFEETAEAIQEARKKTNVRVVVPFIFADNDDLGLTGFSLLTYDGRPAEVGLTAYVGYNLETLGLKVWVLEDGVPPHPNGSIPSQFSHRQDVE